MSAAVTHKQLIAATLKLLDAAQGHGRKPARDPILAILPFLGGVPCEPEEVIRMRLAHQRRRLRGEA